MLQIMLFLIKIAAGAETGNVTVKRLVRWSGLGLLPFLVASLILGTGSSAEAQPKLSGSITVSAAASLTTAFQKIGTDFQKKYKGTTITFNFRVLSDPGHSDPGWSASRRIRFG